MPLEPSQVRLGGVFSNGEIAMISRRSLGLPISLAVVMIVVLVALTIGWVILSVRGATSSSFSGLYWTLLTVGAALFILMVVGVVVYLTLSIKAINLNQRQSNFIDSVTHELKSPIASLKLYLQTLSRRTVSAEQRESFYQSMLGDVERLDQLINHLLDAARLEKGNAASDPPTDVDLAELLSGCCEQLQRRYQVPEASLTIDVASTLVRAPRVDLELIFRNLIDNAIKYAGSPPEVSVDSHFDTRRCEIVVRVADNGRGIPMHQRHKVFARFVRLGHELQRDKPGTGLGLYIVRTIVQRLRGRVTIRDRGALPGTVVEVRLPAEHLPAPTSVEQPVPA